MAKESLGLGVKKSDDVSEWYTQVIQKGELIEYTDVSGCYILRPSSYSIWETVQQFFDAKIKADGVKNAYFPLFIPESLLKKEQEHVEGFTPEVAWVTETGSSKLSERLAVRPTSETIMYPAYAKWIRSHKDLPLRLNQWNNVVRWEFKNPVPFIRSREFLWQEGHTAFATKEEADKEARKILDFYAQVYEELLAVPVIKGTKSEKEKFAGADYSLSIEAFLPSGKAVQCATSHHLGQNFSKPFEIVFLDKEGQKKFVWQNSWGLTTRTIGVMVLVHGDDKGLVIPPRVASTQVVVVPILFDDSKDKVLKKASEIKKSLKGFSVLVDDRDYNPGWKFNEWELKGIPIRIEIGPKDMKSNQVVLVRRDTGKKEVVKIKDLPKKVKDSLSSMQDDLFNKAKKSLQDSIVEVKDWAQFTKAIENKKLVKALWCGSVECEDNIKDKANGAKSLNIPFDQPKNVRGKCIQCNKEAKFYAYFAKSY
ncbi:MAG: proline--tRNA ligase [archaeon]